MRWKPEEFSAQLRDIVDRYDRQGATALCTQLIQHLHGRVSSYPMESARTDLATLRNKRYFALMGSVADAYLRAGVDAPVIRRLLAQAVLDQGNVTAGLAILHGILAGGDISPAENAEVRGLIGRAYKQAYVDAGDCRPPHNREALLSAFDSYHDVYLTDTDVHVWHGINAASLMARADRDGIDTGSRPEAADIATNIRDTISRRDENKSANTWDLATLAESHVALGEWSDAARALSRYAENPEADAFELGGTYRQFQDVWQLDDEEGDERVLLDLLRGELLQRSGGSFERTPKQLQTEVAQSENRKKGLEALLGMDAPQSHTWLMQCLKRSNGVARIRFGQKCGTGFLVRGEALAPCWEGQQLLVTNNHVIATEPLLGITMRPKQVEVTFDALHGGGMDQPKFKVKGGTVLFESPIPELDTTVVELDREVEGVDDFPIAEDMPFGDARVYVIGHPMGGELSYSFQDNKLIDIDERRIHYRSPTEPGNSGSPLFNGDWELVGLHHAGSQQMSRLDDPTQKHPANEGIPLPAVARAARAATAAQSAKSTQS